MSVESGEWPVEAIVVTHPRTRDGLEAGSDGVERVGSGSAGDTCIASFDDAWGEVFREKIGEVVFAWHPIKMESALVDAVFHPVKTHVKGLGLLSAHVAC